MCVGLYRSDFGHVLERVLETVAVRAQVDVDDLDGHLQHGEDVLGHLAVRTVSLGEHHDTVLADQPTNERLRRLRPQAKSSQVAFNKIITVTSAPLTRITRRNKTQYSEEEKQIQ